MWEIKSKEDALNDLLKDLQAYIQSDGSISLSVKELNEKLEKHHFYRKKEQNSGSIVIVRRTIYGTMDLDEVDLAEAAKKHKTSTKRFRK